MEFFKKFIFEIIAIIIGFILGFYMGAMTGGSFDPINGLIQGGILALIALVLGFMVRLIYKAWSRKGVYASVGFIAGALITAVLFPGLGYAIPLLLGAMLLGGIIISLICYKIGAIENNHSRRMIIGSFVIIAIVFLAFYLPRIY